MNGQKNDQLFFSAVQAVNQKGKEEKNLYIEKLITNDLSPKTDGIQTVNIPHSPLNP